jgi:glycerate 2-kinase
MDINQMSTRQVAGIMAALPEKLRFSFPYSLDHYVRTIVVATFLQCGIQDSLAAGKAMLELADGLEPGDLALCCITGGSSALVSVPPDGVTLEAKQDLHRMLLASGARIDRINTVRKHVSQIKGGRLAARLKSIPIVNLTVSDVMGNQIDLITDPTVQDTTTTEDAVRILHALGLWDRLDPSIKDHLDTEAADSPDLSDVSIETALVLNHDSAAAAMASVAERLGYKPVVLSTDFDGEATETGRTVAEAARECLGVGLPSEPPCVLIGCGGESSVMLKSLRSVMGKGGPNQEVALSAAMSLLQGDPVVILSMDTDGSDGGSTSAGGIVDSQTLSRALALGEDPEQHLSDHTSGEVLGCLGDLLDTGATGTNVNDMFVAVVGEVP